MVDGNPGLPKADMTPDEKISESTTDESGSAAAKTPSSSENGASKSPAPKARKKRKATKTSSKSSGKGSAAKRTTKKSAPADEASKKATASPAPAEKGTDSAEEQALSSWDRYQLASHKDRPRTSDYLKAVFTEFMEISGDRGFRDDPAVICGMARIDARPVVVIGQEMGKEARERHLRNYGMMHPEGYRKAMRVMNLASRFKMPVVIMIDTKGAYPGTGAEERGQAEAIARNIRDMYKLKVPVVVTVIGAGASGGALGIGLGDRVLMMENSWYNVISPEGCAAILWNDPAMAPRAAEALRLTAEEVFKLGVIDEIVSEPNGGAHLDSEATFESFREAINRNLKELDKLSTQQLLLARAEKYRKMGVFRTQSSDQQT